MIKIENINEQMVQEMIAKAVRSSEDEVTEQFKVLISQEVLKILLVPRTGPS